jgi:hypothetical protein
MGPRFRGDDRSRTRWLRLAKTPVGFVSPKCISLACPGRSAARSGALQTPISGLPEIGDEMCASRVNPTCVDRFSLWRSRISDAPLRWRSRCVASGTTCPPTTTTFSSAFSYLSCSTRLRHGVTLRMRSGLSHGPISILSQVVWSHASVHNDLVTVATRARVHLAVVAGRWQRDHQNYKKFSRLIDRNSVRSLLIENSINSDE